MAHKYRNHYHHGDHEWTDEWDAMCNDECPGCGHEIEPHASDILGNSGKAIATIDHVGVGWTPESCPGRTNVRTIHITTEVTITQES